MGLDIKRKERLEVSRTLRHAGREPKRRGAVRVEHLVEQYEADLSTLERTYPVTVSPARLERLDAFHRMHLDTLAEVDLDGLEADAQVDLVLLDNHIRRRLHAIERARATLARARPLLSFAEPILDLENAHRLHQRPPADLTARRLDALARAVRALTDAIGADSPERPTEAADPGLANLAADAVAELREALKRWFAFYDDYDPVATWWLKGPCAGADEALGAYERRLREAAAPGDRIAGTPIGEEAVRAELRDDLIAYEPSEVLAIARRELAWCRAEMVRASREMGLGDDWRAALERVKEMHVPPGDQPEMIYGLAAEARAFLDAHGLVTVPPLCDETWRAEMMSPERQLVNPFFLGGEVIRISYPTSTMSHAQRLMSMRANSTYLSRSTVFHELIPGHYLQQFMTARHMPHRRLFRTPYWSEGNAFYWEMLLWNLGFARRPEERIGMLFWRSHRAARVLYTLGFHSGRMTTEECVEMLVRDIGHERDSAMGEVRRLFDPHYAPLYQCAYLLGALQFRALHEELVVGASMSERSFHDAILRQGPMPVEILRAVLRGERLTPPYLAHWRFYGDPGSEDPAHAPSGSSRERGAGGPNP